MNKKKKEVKVEDMLIKEDGFTKMKEEKEITVNIKISRDEAFKAGFWAGCGLWIVGFVILLVLGTLGLIS